jgi:hypothetical protein
MCFYGNYSSRLATNPNHALIFDALNNHVIMMNDGIPSSGDLAQCMLPFRQERLRIWKFEARDGATDIRRAAMFISSGMAILSKKHMHIITQILREGEKEERGAF